MQYYRIRKKSFVLLISYLCAAILALAFASFRLDQKSSGYERSINAGYARAFASLSADIAELDMSLQKALYSSSPALLSALCSNIYGRASAAQASMAELPLSDITLENAAAFISRTGDYAYALARKVSGGSSLSDDEYAALKSLSGTAAILSQNLTEMQTELESGSLRISDIGLNDIGQDEPSALLGERFQDIESEFPEIPTLIYDGPFSQHIDTSAARLLSGLPEVSQAQALKIAAAFSGIPENELTFAYRTETEIPLYYFSADSGASSVSVTVQGGKVFSMSKYRSSGGEAAIDTDSAVAAAKDFLRQHGFASLQESYWVRYDDMLLINFAALDNDYVCYPDLVKAEVSLYSGEIIGFEAAGYIANHSSRSFPNQLITRDEAEKGVSPLLDIIGHKLCIIPSSGKNELFCYEFYCENERSDHYLVYINAQSGEQERILRLIEDGNGTLTM